MQPFRALAAFRSSFRPFATSTDVGNIDKLFERLNATLGNEYVKSSDHADSKDSTGNRTQAPSIIVRPGKTDEVAAVTRLCNETRTALVTSEHLQPPTSNAVVIDLTRLDRILSVNSTDFDAEIEPGVTWRALDSHLAANSPLMFTCDYGRDVSIGDLISMGGGGQMAIRYGSIISNLKNLEIVLADGSIIHTRGEGRRPWKSSAGYHLSELFIGSQGTLGIITAATVMLHARPSCVTAARCVFPDIQHAISAVIDVRQLALPLAKLELLDEHSQMADERHIEAPMLFFEFHGSSEEELRVQTQAAKDICLLNSGTEFKWSLEEEQRIELWQPRDRAYAAIRRADDEHEPKAAGGGITTDVCVPLHALGRVISQAHNDMQALDVPGSIVGHVGEGHFDIAFSNSNIANGGDGSTDVNTRSKRLHEFSDRLITSALDAGGTCIGQHVGGINRRSHLKRELGEPTWNLMKSIKQTLDPNNILNPNKLFQKPN